MKAGILKTSDPHIRLVEPDIDRDALLGVNWLAGEAGRQTLTLMGVADDDNRPTTFEEERVRVRDFIDKPDVLNWMIELDGSVVGAIWADLVPTRYLQAPSLHIMIGDPSARGRGVGTTSFGTVISHLRNREFPTLYSRHLLSNTASGRLLSDNGFQSDGEPYTDEDGLEWQNARLTLTAQ